MLQARAAVAMSPIDTLLAELVDCFKRLTSYDVPPPKSYLKFLMTCKSDTHINVPASDSSWAKLTQLLQDHNKAVGALTLLQTMVDESDVRAKQAGERFDLVAAIVNGMMRPDAGLQELYSALECADCIACHPTGLQTFDARRGRGLKRQIWDGSRAHRHAHHNPPVEPGSCCCQRQVSGL